MTPAVGVWAAVFLGLGVWWFAARGPGAPDVLPGAVLFGTVATIVWMGLLDLAGVHWSAAVLLGPAIPALVVSILLAPRGVTRYRVHDWWLVGAAAAVMVRVVAAAATPAFGWDFRYIWGLKARVFASAGGHDLGWLAWPGHASAHPSYPPGWSDLLAAGAALGAPIDAVAAAWQAVLIAALAALCWGATTGCPGWVRALAATAAAWSPVIGDPRHSGYAEPLLAFLAAAGLMALAGAARGESGAVATLAAAVAGLALTKNEGVALGLGLVAGAATVGGIRRAWPALATLAAAVLVWRGTFPTGLTAADGDLSPSLASAARHASEAPSALAAAVTATPALALVAVVWLLCLVSWWAPGLRGVRVAIAVWALAVAAAYLVTTESLAWHLASSADRVLAAPLPGVLALVLGAAFSGPAAAVERSEPAASRGGSPSA